MDTLRIIDNVTDKACLALISNAGDLKAILTTKHKIGYKIKALQNSELPSKANQLKFLRDAVQYGLASWIKSMFDGKTLNCPVPRTCGLYGDTTVQFFIANQGQIVADAISHKERLAADKKAEKEAAENLAVQQASEAALQAADTSLQAQNQIELVLGLLKSMTASQRDIVAAELIAIQSEHDELQATGT